MRAPWTDWRPCVYLRGWLTAEALRRRPMTWIFRAPPQPRWSSRWRSALVCGCSSALPASDLVGRTVTMPDRITCAAPAYLERHGCPQTPDDLASHRAVGLRSLTSGELAPFEFVLPQGLMRMDVAAPLSVTGTESFLDGVRLGLGLAQMPVFHVERDIAEGRLQRILPEYPVPPGPVSVLYPRSRQLSPRVRVFIDWIVQRVSPSAETERWYRP